MTIKNKKDNETYTKDFNSVNDAECWVINHLDLSKNWEIKQADDWTYCAECDDEFLNDEKCNCEE